MIRVSKARPCPICARADWCLLAEDESAAICARTESPRRCGDAGWLHVLRPGERSRDGQSFRRVVIRAAVTGPDLTALADECRRGLPLSRLTWLADHLGVHAEALRRLAVGWSEPHRAYSFPMRRVRGGPVVGIRLRTPEGKKFAIKGGHEGLFLPVDWPAAGGGPLYVVEGPTDAAAALDLGFPAVGRPSCSGGRELVGDLVRAGGWRRVVIVADGDEPGRRGAADLARRLALIAEVRVIEPPLPHKDLRAWLKSGATARDVTNIGASTEPMHITITRTRTHV